MRLKRTNSSEWASQSDQALIVAGEFRSWLQTYMSELANRLPEFPGEFRDLCTVLSQECRTIVSSSTPPTEPLQSTRMMAILVKRLRENQPTRWVSGTATREDNVRKFLRYLTAATPLLRGLDEVVEPDIKREALILFYGSVLQFARIMEDTNPTPYYDAYEKRKLRAVCEQELSSGSGDTPIPPAPAPPPTRLPPQFAHQNGHADITQPELNDEKTIVGVTPDFTPGELNAIPEIPDHELHALIGRGGVGTVYRGLQRFLDRPCAIKVLSIPDAGHRQDIVERFRREAKILANLSHPNIVSCYQAGITKKDEIYIVMELINGPTLDEYLQEHGALPQRQAVELIHQLAQALGYAFEREIIHRDVKAQNILLQPSDQSAEEGALGYMPKLVDLGLARFQYAATGDNALTIQGELIGTPSVMAPEQFENPDAVDQRTDIYSLGCVFFYLLTGQTPFNYRNIAEIMRVKLIGGVPDPQKVNPQVDSRIAKLVRMMMAKKAAERPQNYIELMRQCHDILRRLKSGQTRTGGAISKIVQRIGGNWGGDKG